MMRNKTGNFTGWALMLLGIMMLGVPMVAMAVESHTVERHPQGGTQITTVAKQGACTIDLTAPKTTGSCHLKVTDPPAKLIVKDWYDAGGLLEMQKYLLRKGISEKNIDGVARNFSLRDKSYPMLFWGARRLHAPSVLDTAPGTTKKWEKRTVSPDAAYTKDELKTAMDAAVKWAKARKKYRGNEFGK